MNESPRPPRDRGGFTLIEVMIAVIVLAIGVIALLGSSAMVTRMLGQGRHATQAVEVATRRLENLRRAAYATATPCTDAAFVGGTATGTGYTETWTITTPAGFPELRVVTDSVVYRTTRGNARLGLETRVLCR